MPEAEGLAGTRLSDIEQPDVDVVLFGQEPKPLAAEMLAKLEAGLAAGRTICIAAETRGVLRAALGAVDCCVLRSPGMNDG